MKDTTLSSTHNLSRRDFLRDTSKVGVACGLACLCPFSSLMGMEQSADIPDPDKLNYCGYVCPKECPMKQAGLSGDVEQKKKAYEMWRIKERYDLDFEPAKVFCNGCKTDKPLGVAVDNCPVRKCAVKTGVRSCIECKELPTCEEKLWTEFPGFRKQMLAKQKIYFNA